MLVAVYALPAALGVYALRDAYSMLFLGCLATALAAYYAGFAFTGRLVSDAAPARSGRKWWFEPVVIERLSVSVVFVYLLLVVYLALTADQLALFVALGLGEGAGQVAVAEAREAFLQTRTGVERVFVYVNAILFRAVLPPIMVFLYMRVHPARHLLLGALLFACMLSLEKSLPLFLLVPLLTYFVLIGRVRRAGGLLALAVLAIVIATTLSIGTEPDSAVVRQAEGSLLVTEREGDRRNLFWLAQTINSTDDETKSMKEKDARANRAAGAWAALNARNRIVNGAMEIDRLNDGGWIMPDAPRYILDGWFAHFSVGKKLAFQQVSEAPAGFSRSLKISVEHDYVPAADEAFELQQPIEGFKLRDLALGTGWAQPLTLSFWVRTTLPGTYNVTIGSGAYNRGYLMVYEVPRADKWHRVSLTVPGPTTGDVGLWPRHTGRALVVSFNLGAGAAYHRKLTKNWEVGFYRQSPDALALVRHSGAALYLTGIQIERGPAATNFERRTAQQEMRLLEEFAPSRAADDWYLEPIRKRAEFMVNRVLWIPYITAYDWLRYQDEVLDGRFLYGRTIGPVATLYGEERFFAERAIFRYQFGEGATSTATAGAVFFADAYMNFGWIGVVLYAALIGAIFRVIARSRSLPIMAASVMASFGLMVASLTANLLSGGLAVLAGLAFLARGIGGPAYPGSVPS